MCDPSLTCRASRPPARSDGSARVSNPGSRIGTKAVETIVLTVVHLEREKVRAQAHMNLVTPAPSDSSTNLVVRNGGV